MRGGVEVIKELVIESCSELLHGDTVFHLRVKFNHLEALTLLVTMAKEGEFARGNQNGNTILHLVVTLKQSEQYSRDFKSLEIQHAFIEAGVRRSKELNRSAPPQSTIAAIVSSDSSIAATLPSKASKVKSWFLKLMKYLEYDREETRGALMIIATVIATMTFQAGLNPPGGVWQQNFKDSTGGPACSEECL
ncbi:hypothetical protein P3X46_004566 [Hevea brasiliensis]|uniref:PGG domain-containing protein n=1 Tax=Hevea brasiliensis TaxID=3981 RepID=A0ABQ9N012_HEVBR|nr:hypothetical protein P3X46_004566 [Hevea brasiliensis]